MTIYLTYNDLPSGIFTSQVIDVVKFISKEFNQEIKLVSFISIRNFFKNRKTIKQHHSDAIILPMFPGVHRWKNNILILKILLFFINPTKIIARSVIACQLALKSKNKNTKIVYDGRGAISAEWHEYKVVNHPKLINTIYNLEKEVVLHSDYRIAVSNALLMYWKNEFGLLSNNSVVIPCTINKAFENIEISNETIIESRKKLGLTKDDLVFIYSGSLAGWQSFDLLYNFIKPIMQNVQNAKLVFLSDKDDNIIRLEQEFPKKVICKKVKPNEVPQYLLAGDYGLLIRENSITNQVASPVKFAEYLACGLKVIISNNIGDYSDLINKNSFLGYLSKYSNVDFTPVSINKKINIKEFAIQYFTKQAHLKQYHQIVQF